MKARYDIHRVMDRGKEVLRGFAVRRYDDGHPAPLYRGKRPLWTGFVEDIIDANDLFMTEKGARDVVDIEIRANKSDVKSSYQEKRAAREHEQMRRELWCNVYAAVRTNTEAAPMFAADAALKIFDEKFPAPI